MAHSPVKLIFGGGVFVTSNDEFSKPENISQVLDLLEKRGITTIDTASAYGPSERVLGQANATARFTVDTKYPGGMSAKPSTKDVVVASAKESLQALNAKSVDVYYIHVPDVRVPLKQTLEGIDELYRSGAFKRFGVSNFTIPMVEEVIRIARERGFVQPSVYQGNYNAFSRHVETSLFPLLRKNNIAFYAYSPIAGGFLAKRPEDLASGTGRWDPNSEHPAGGIYTSLYVKPPKMLEGLERWGLIAKEEGMSNAELAYRWVVYNSGLRGELGDGVIIGAKNHAQFNEALEGIEKGPLPSEAARKIDELWEVIKDEAPSDDPTVTLKALLA